MVYHTALNLTTDLSSEELTTDSDSMNSSLDREEQHYENFFSSPGHGEDKNDCSSNNSRPTGSCKSSQVEQQTSEDGDQKYSRNNVSSALEMQRAAESMAMLSYRPYHTGDVRTGQFADPRQPLYPCHPVPGCPQMTVKEEPIDEDKSDDIVIDLTPKGFITNSQFNKNIPGHPAYMGVSGSTNRDALPGNIPSHVSASEADFSDSESPDNSPKEGEDQEDDMLTGNFHFSIPKGDMTGTIHSHPRAKREFVPDDKKDQQYWNKRQKNNISARRSRMKRKQMEQVMEKRMLELQEENIQLKHELEALKKMCNVKNKIEMDLTSSPARSPASTTSSGIGTSCSNLSSGGSSEHSTSSSPLLHSEEDKSKKVDIQTRAEVDPSEEADKRTDYSEHFQQFVSTNSPTRSTNSPPAVHTNNSTTHDSSAFAHSMDSDHISSRPTTVAPPAAHSGSTHGSYYHLPIPHTPEINHFPAHASSGYRPPYWPAVAVPMLNKSQLPYWVPFSPHYHLGADQLYSGSSSPSSSDSLVLCCSNQLSNEDDSKSNRSSSNSQGAHEDKFRHHVPLKCRMKPEDHSALQPTTSA